MNEASPQVTGEWAASTSDGVDTFLESALRQQERFWGEGKRVTVEELLAAQPHLKANVSVVLELIVNEALLRLDSGGDAPFEEYQQRFPEHADALRIQWEVDRALFNRLSKRSSHPEQKPRLKLEKVGRYEVQKLVHPTRAYFV